MLQSGALTQLEWIDRCAQLALDGVEFAAAHFPRSDDDYLAQLKKLCADRGLTVTGICIDVPFGGADVDREIREMGAWIGHAVSLGAPLLRFACGAASGSPGIAWRELVRGLKHASAEAKERNVTLALEAKAATLVAGPAELKRAFKECDSAWLRWAASAAQLRGNDAVEWRELMDDAVLALTDGSPGDDDALKAARSGGFIGFVSVESSGEDEDTALSSALARLSG